MPVLPAVGQDEASGDGGDDNPDGGYLQECDEDRSRHCDAARNPVEPVLDCHAEYRGGNQGDHCRADTLEDGLDGGVVLECGEDSGDQQYYYERRHHAAEGGDDAAFYPGEPVSYENRHVYGYQSGG